MIYENEEDNVKGWGIIAHNFIVSEGDKKRVRFFIKAMHEAKIATERKMRQELDSKILNMDQNVLTHMLGRTV